ncbi:universal stress protein [Luedemannella helvata]|uniref:Universal stress protein n=1 Tax=Luedemannella helvata TaxID=349315 RepID=A0ABP4WTL3_9ACTN
MSKALSGVVVGVDVGTASDAAVELAADLAARHGRPLLLLHVLELTVLTGPLPFAVDIERLQAAREVMLADQAVELCRRHPSVEISSAVAVGNAAATLAEASRTAWTVVVGCRGRGGFTELLLGSVSAQLCEHAHGPVIVARPAEPGQGPSPGLPVVVGVDGSPGSEAAVGYAYAEADSRDVALVVRHVWWLPGGEGIAPAGGRPVDLASLEEEAGRVVAEVVAGWSATFPDVDVQVRLSHGSDPEAALVEASAHACLVVVGSRGRGGFAGLLLGSVSQALVHHAGCPVAIVRSHRAP